jgi:hypothetical protein
MVGLSLVLYVTRSEWERPTIGGFREGCEVKASGLVTMKAGGTMFGEMSGEQISDCIDGKRSKWKDAM